MRAARAEAFRAVSQCHRIGATGLSIVLVFMGWAAAMTGDWSSAVLAVLALTASVAVVVAAVGWLTSWMGSRWSVLGWPVLASVTLVPLHAVAPTASALLAGVIVVSFLFVGVSTPPGTSVLLVPGALLVLLGSTELDVNEAIVRLPIAVGIWIVVAELPARLLAELRRKEAALIEAATRDSLTGAFNRANLDQVVDSLGPDDAVVLVDLDHFKRFNDHSGHVAGDAALSAFAAELMRQARGQDWVFRYGGEEFLLVCPGATVAEAHRLIGRVAQQWEQSPFDLTFSAGIEAGGPGAVERADDLLYEAKRRGRGQVVRPEASPSD